MARAQPDPRELAHQITLLVGHRRAAVDGDRVLAVARLDLTPAPRDIVQRFVPGSRIKPAALPPTADQWLSQAVGVVHLLVGHDAFRAE
jgi:hypothetical protein